MNFKKVSSEITTLQSDYVTNENIHLFKGQHVQIMQRLSNDMYVVQLLNNLDLSSGITASIAASSNASKQPIEVQIPVSLIKYRSFNRNTNTLDDENEDGGKSGAAKRKGSFKKWLRSSHRKLTSSPMMTPQQRSNAKEINGAKIFGADSDNLKIKKVLSNSEDLKIKNWLIEETNNEEDEENNLIEQTILENPVVCSRLSSLENSTISQQQQQKTSSQIAQKQQQSNLTSQNDQEDQEDLLTSALIPPPMNVIKQEQSEQNSMSGSFNKIPNQSIDIQKELKLWQSKMENSKRPLSSTTGGFEADQQQQLTGEQGDQQKSNDSHPQQASPSIMTETKLNYAIKELLTTERDYVNDLAILIDKFMEGINRNEVSMPQDMAGKEKIVFGNVQQIFEWHKNIFLPELEKCLNEPPSYIGQLFIKYENRFQMYVKYCENKPKSEFIVSEYDTYFEELRLKLNQKLNIQDLLIKPIQRIMKYQLMLKEIRKFMEKEKMDCSVMDRAINITVTLPKNADDMMNLGRLQGFEGRITAQGKLLLQDTLLVHEPTSDEVPPKPAKKLIASVAAQSDKQGAEKFKERRVFLFQQIIIFSEMVAPAAKSKFTSPKYIFKCDMKVNKLKLDKDDATLAFTLVDKTPGESAQLRKIVCQCEDVNKYNNWINHLQGLLDMQNQFLLNLQNPQAAIQKIASGNSGAISPNSSKSSNHHHHHTQGNKEQQQQQQQSSSSSSSHHSSLTSQLNDFFKSTFNFSSSSSSSSSGTNATPLSPLSSKSTISPSSKQQPQQLVDLATQMSLNNTTTATMTSNGNENQSSRKNSGNSVAPTTNIPNYAKCISSYTAITEDEISVQKGDLVQIIVANMHNRFLVHREANDQQPAAEGWIPGFVIGSQISSLPPS